MPVRNRICLLLITLILTAAIPSQASEWKAGIGKVVITPKTSMWMAGYGARTKPSEGLVHDLWAKALILEDPSGKKAILVTLDLCGIGRDLAEPIRSKIATQNGTTHDRVVLACSHTHSGPVVGGNLITMYRLDEAERAKVDAYAAALGGLILEAVTQGVADLAPAEISWGVGRAHFAVNRRANKEADVPALRQSISLEGPVDHDVPVLRVNSPSGRLRAVVGGYACHCTVLDGQKFSGDYAGHAQIELEKTHPGATALFVAGCGADQNPTPRRRPELAELYGKQLAGSIEQVLLQPMRSIKGSMRTADQETDVLFDKLPSQAQVDTDALSKDFYVSSRAKSLQKKLTVQGKLDQTYPYPVQVWRLDELTWIFLGGEVVVDFSLRLKRNLGSNTWVSAYCNDVMSYIPSERIRKEGGYEGGGAMLYYGLPAPWAAGIEEKIIKSVGELMSRTNP